MFITWSSDSLNINMSMDFRSSSIPHANTSKLRTYHQNINIQRSAKSVLISPYWHTCSSIRITAANSGRQFRSHIHIRADSMRIMRGLPIATYIKQPSLLQAHREQGIFVLHPFMINCLWQLSPLSSNLIHSHKNKKPPEISEGFSQFTLNCNNPYPEESIRLMSLSTFSFKYPYTSSDMCFWC